MTIRLQLGTTSKNSISSIVEWCLSVKCNKWGVEIKRTQGSVASVSSCSATPPLDPKGWDRRRVCWRLLLHSLSRVDASAPASSPGLARSVTLMRQARPDLSTSRMSHVACQFAVDGNTDARLNRSSSKYPIRSLDWDLRQ